MLLHKYLVSPLPVIGVVFQYHPLVSIKPRVLMAEVYIFHLTLVVLGRCLHQELELGGEFPYHPPDNIKPR
jgi:hypothetical protein